MDTVLTAPSALLHNGEADVTDDYTLTYQWTDAQGNPVGTGATLQVTPTAATTYTCTITAACTLDSTQVLTGQCLHPADAPRHHPRGGDRPGPGHPHPGPAEKPERHPLPHRPAGPGGQRLGKHPPPSPGCAPWSLNWTLPLAPRWAPSPVQEGTYYYLEGTQGQALLSQVTFTSPQAGTYGINFRAYGDALYCGRLEILVQETDVPPRRGGQGL